MKLTDFLQDVGPVVAYYPRLCPLCGGVNATLLLCQLLYWDGKQADPAGWIYKTQEDLSEELGMTRTEQENARRTLRGNGFLEEDRRGIPARLYYRIDKHAVNAAWETYMSSTVEPEDAGFPHSRM